MTTGFHGPKDEPWRGCERTLTGDHIPAERPGVGVYCKVCGVVKTPPSFSPPANYARSPLPREKPAGGRAPRNRRSDEAWRSFTPEELGERERVIFDVLVETPLTTWEMEQRLQGKHQSVSATMSRMYHRKRVIRPSGLARPTDTGRLADVYEVGDPLAPDAPNPYRTQRGGSS